MSGATWPDVGLALVAFAREEPWTFIGVFAAICLIVWCLFPRATQVLMAAYRAERRIRGRDAQPPEHPSRGEQDDD